MSIAIVVLTFNRVHLLRQCVENVLARTSPDTTEIVIWNNASDDGTAQYLDALDDPRIKVVHHERNIGLNGYTRAFALTSAHHLVEVDDDIVDAPPEWDRRLSDAFERLPQIGYLAANLVDNPNDATARLVYGPMASNYRIEDVNGVRLKLGPVGGGCSLTSRELHDRVGGFREKEKAIFWQEDAEYIAAIQQLGYGAAYLADLEVLHAGGEYYAPVAPAKAAYWKAYRRKVIVKTAVKLILVRIPFVRRLNARFRWFKVPKL